MSLAHVVRFARSVALVTSVPLVAAQASLAPADAPVRDPHNPYLNAGCPLPEPAEGGACTATLSCSYGAGMCGTQCDCLPPTGAARHWHCHTVCTGPLSPPEQG